MATQTVKTLTIDNFSGEITPDMIGSLNSGQCPIALTPYGKLPFGRYKNRGLQFIEGNNLIASNFFEAPLHTVKVFINTPSLAPTVFTVDWGGAAYNIQVANTTVPTPDVDTKVQFTNSIADTLHYGGGMFYDPNAKVIVVGTDGGAYYTNANPMGNPTTATFTAVSGSWNLIGIPRPVCFFRGTLYVGDGEKLVSLNSSYTAIASNSVLALTVPVGWVIRNLKVSPDGTYLIITASPRTQVNDFRIDQGQQPQFQPLDSVVLYWNGSDAGYSSMQYFAGLNIVSLAVSSTDAVMFAKDIDGIGIYDLTGNKLAYIDDVSENGEANQFQSYPPYPWSIDAIGKKFFFLFQQGNNLYIYMFDLETRKLVSLYQDSSANTGSVVGGLCIASIAANSVISGSWQLTTKSKLYYFFTKITGGTSYGYYIHLGNYGGNMAGLYPTQFEEFGRKIRPVSIRVFTYPTAAGNSFIVRLQDIQLNNLFNQTYTFAAGGDLTKAQGALTKIEWQVKSKAVDAMSLQILPNASTPFFVKKVEIDYLDDLNPSNA